MRFDDFVLQMDATARGGFRARVIKSPFGEGATTFALSAGAGSSLAGGDPGAAVSRDIAHAASGPAQGGVPPLEVGSEIFRSVFQGQVRSLLDKSRGLLERSHESGLRLKIKLDPSDPDTAALSDLPWELLCDGETEDFLALSRQTSVVRYLDVPRSSQPIAFTPPLRILAVGASPSGLPPLDIDQEVRHLEALDRDVSGVEVRFLKHASAGAVREALSAGTYHVLHFMGHGTFDRTGGEGMLAFEGADKHLDLVSGKAFATKIRDHRSLGVVVLNACNTARTGHQAGASSFRGVATALVLGGVPAVVAMQRPITDRAAIGFSSALYRHLARGDSIDEALTEGRQAIHSAEPEAFEWATPVLFLRIPEGNVFVASAAPEAQPPAGPAPVHSPVQAPIQASPAPALAPAAREEPRLVAAGLAGAGRRPSRRQLTAAGTAAAGLLAGALYFVIPRSSPAPPSQAGQQGQPTPPGGAGQQASTGTGGGGAQASPSSSGKQGQGSTTQTSTPGPKNVRTGALHTSPSPEMHAGLQNPISTQPNSPGNPTPPVPDTVQHPDTTPKTDPAPAPVDVSSLSATAQSIALRSGGGLRVTVAFHNGGAQALSVLLDRRSAELSDNQGQRYIALRTSLPQAGANPRLDLAAGADSTVQLDFPAAKLGSKKFYLALATDDGQSLSVGGGALTLADTP